jgi:hypothetical protein
LNTQLLSGRQRAAGDSLRAAFVEHRIFAGSGRGCPGGDGRANLNDVRSRLVADGAQLAIIHEVANETGSRVPHRQNLTSRRAICRTCAFPHGRPLALFEHPSRWDDRGDVVMIGLDGHRTVLGTGFSGLEGLAWTAQGGSVLFSAGVQG